MNQKTEFLNTQELAQRWGLGVPTLHGWRSKGTGPAFVKIGQKVLYSKETVLAYEAAQTRSSTAAVAVAVA